MSDPPYRADHRGITPSRHYRILGCGTLLAGVLGYVGLVDPHNPNTVFPPCLFRMLTGWNCPACGGLRMAHDVLRGDLAAAVTDNAFLLVGIPLLVLWMLTRRRRDAAPPIPTIVAAVLVTGAWTVLRNLPEFPLAPTVLPG